MRNTENNYSTPKAEIIRIDSIDVITTSLPGDDNTVGPWVDID